MGKLGIKSLRSSIGMLRTPGAHDLKPVHRSGSDEKRMRGRALQTARKRLFDAQPLCVACLAEGRYREAVERDHVIPLSQGGTDDPSNTQPLCEACHLVKSINERIIDCSPVNQSNSTNAPKWGGGG